MLERKYFPILFVLLGVLSFITISPAGAQEFPTRPVKLITPYSASGPSGISSRFLAEVGQKYLGQPFIVDHRVGASGQIAADFLARQKPDGYTVGNFFYSQTHGEYFTQFRTSTSTSKDFRAVAQWSSDTFGVIVKADEPFNNLKELIEYVKKNPGLPYGSGGGKGNLYHVSMTAFEKMAGIKLNDIPTTGSMEILQQILGGHLRMGLGSPAVFAPYIKAGQVKSLAFLSDNRIADCPNVATFKEQGYDIGFRDIYLAAFAPAKTPDPIVAKLREIIKKTCHDADFISRMEKIGLRPVYSDGEALEKKINDTTNVLVKVFKDLGYL